MKTCTNRIPDNCDSYECGRPEVRAGRCEVCLPIAIVAAVARLDEMEHAAAEARARLRDLEGGTTDHAKRLAEIGEAVRERLPLSPCDGALLWEQLRAASEALAAAGIPADGRSLAERVKALAHDARYGASYCESWERLRKSKDADDIARAQVTRDLDILRRAAIATAVSLGEVLPEDAGPEAIAASLRRGAERAKPARRDDCGGTDAPHGHRFGCGMEPEDDAELPASG